MADTKRYASVPVLTLADDLSSSGVYIKTTTANDWGGNALTTADFNTDYIPATIINDAKTLVEFILIDATTIGNLTTTGALIYKRGLKYYAEGDTTDSDEVTANKLAWTQGESKLLIGTNPPWMYGKFPSKENDETITGLWTFPASGSANVAVVASATNPPLLDAEFATKKYVDDTAIAGAPDATTTVKGIVEIATQAEVDAGTTTGGTGASVVVRPPELANVIQDGSYVYAADSVGTDSYAITLVPAITAYVTGQVFHFKAGTANTGASTLNVNGLGAKTLKYANDRDTVTGDIEVGSIVTVAYDGTNFQILSISAGTIVTDLAMQLNTGYSANVTGTNLATLTAGNASKGDSLHSHILDWQRLVIPVSNSNTVPEMAANTSALSWCFSSDASYLYLTAAQSLTPTMKVYRFIRDAVTGTYYYNNSVQVFSGGGAGGLAFGAVSGNYIYVVYNDSAQKMKRYDLDLTNETAITISGGDNDETMGLTIIGSTFYILASNDLTGGVYTLSGTTLTRNSTLTAISGAMSTSCTRIRNLASTSNKLVFSWNTATSPIGTGGTTAMRFSSTGLTGGAATETTIARDLHVNGLNIIPLGTSTTEWVVIGSNGTVASGITEFYLTRISASVLGL